MKKVHSIDYVIDMFKVLADNPYSLLWELVEDFECNGHIISVKSSNQYKQVKIDGIYQSIGGSIKIGTLGGHGKTYEPIDYVYHLLKNDLDTDSKIENESNNLDFGEGTEKEIREAIAARSEKIRINEDAVIKIFNKSDDEYQKLRIASDLMMLYSNDIYYVGETYFDYGQNWKWTTILQKDAQWGAIQKLNPKEQKDIITAHDATTLGKAVDEVLKEKSYLPKKDA